MIVIGSRVAHFLFVPILGHSSRLWIIYRSISAGVIILAIAVVATAIGPFYPIAVTLIYYDQRIRREGYDIELMMNAAGMNPPELVSADVNSFAPASTEDARA